MEDLSVLLSNHKVLASIVFGGLLLLHEKRKKGKGESPAGGETGEKKLQREATHSVQRLAAIAHGGPIDHANGTIAGHSKVLAVKNDDFDLNKTIFESVDSALNRLILKAKLGNVYYWSDEAVVAVKAEFDAATQGGKLLLAPSEATPSPSSSVGRPLRDPKSVAIFDFMENECNFLCEHADGSFLDHLFFCRDYCSVHFAGQSPNVLLLHSICGVATNLFPMDVSKLPKLQSMLTPDEFTHVLAFPSILRLLYDLRLLKALQEARSQGKLGSLKGIKFHRVMDNEPLSLTAEQFWTHLNFQVVHLLDFLPCCFWQSQLGDPLFGLFIELHEFLAGTGNLRATVDFNLTNAKEIDQVDGMPLSLGRLISKFAPSTIQRTLASKSIRRWSATKGHSLDFELEFN